MLFCVPKGGSERLQEFASQIRLIDFGFRIEVTKKQRQVHFMLPRCGGIPLGSRKESLLMGAKLKDRLTFGLPSNQAPLSEQLLSTINQTS
jgi:hypothetical protein